MKKRQNHIDEIRNIRTLVNVIKSGTVGRYEYKGKSIFVGYRHGKDEKGQTRKQRLYRQRRSQGLCVACGDKVTNENPQTEKLFRLCDHHRKQIDQKK